MTNQNRVTIILSWSGKPLERKEEIEKGSYIILSRKGEQMIEVTLNGGEVILNEEEKRVGKQTEIQKQNELIVKTRIENYIQIESEKETTRERIEKVLKEIHREDASTDIERTYINKGPIRNKINELKEKIRKIITKIRGEELKGEEKEVLYLIPKEWTFEHNTMAVELECSITECEKQKMALEREKTVGVKDRRKRIKAITRMMQTSVKQVIGLEESERKLEVQQQTYIAMKAYYNTRIKELEEEKVRARGKELEQIEEKHVKNKSIWATRTDTDKVVPRTSHTLLNLIQKHQKIYGSYSQALLKVKKQLRKHTEVKNKIISIITTRGKEETIHSLESKSKDINLILSAVMKEIEDIEETNKDEKIFEIFNNYTRLLSDIQEIITNQEFRVKSFSSLQYNANMAKMLENLEAIDELEDYMEYDYEKELRILKFAHNIPKAFEESCEEVKRRHNFAKEINQDMMKSFDLIKEKICTENEKREQFNRKLIGLLGKESQIHIIPGLNQKLSEEAVNLMIDQELPSTHEIAQAQQKNKYVEISNLDESISSYKSEQLTEDECEGTDVVKQHLYALVEEYKGAAEAQQRENVKLEEENKKLGLKLNYIKVQDKENSRDYLLNKIQTLEAENRSLQNEAQENAKTNEKQLENIKSLSKKLELEKEKTDENMKELAKNRVAVKHLTQQLKEVLIEMNGQKAQHEADITELKSNNQMLKNELATKNKKIESLKMDIDFLNSSLDRNKTESNTEKSDIEKQLKEVHLNHQKIIQDLKDEHQDLTKQYHTVTNKYKNERTALTRELNHARIKIEQLKKENASQILDYKNEINSLNDEIKSYVKKLDAAQEEIKSCLESKTKKDDEINKWKAKCADFENLIKSYTSSKPSSTSIPTTQTIKMESIRDTIRDINRQCLSKYRDNQKDITKFVNSVNKFHKDYSSLTAMRDKIINISGRFELVLQVIRLLCETLAPFEEVSGRVKFFNDSVKKTYCDYLLKTSHTLRSLAAEPEPATDELKIDSVVDLHKKNGKWYIESSSSTIEYILNPDCVKALEDRFGGKTDKACGKVIFFEETENNVIRVTCAFDM